MDKHPEAGLASPNDVAVAVDFSMGAGDQSECRCSHGEGCLHGCATLTTASDLAIVRVEERLCAMTDWEKRYRDGDTPWDKGHAAPPLVELIERLGSGVFGDGFVCVPGCGAGHDVRLLASHGLRVLGVDVAESAIQLARSFPAAGAEDYVLGDFLVPASLGGLEVTAIWEHTCFCAIDPSRRRDYAAAAARLLVPGGVLAGVFFLTPYDSGEVSEGPPFESTVEDIEACLEPWFEKVDAWVPQAAYPGRAGREWMAVFRRKPNV